MSKNTPIKMKKTTSKFANDKYEVFESSSDCVLNEYVKELSNYPVLSASEEKELAKLAAEGDKEARKKLIQSNLRLVVCIAKKAIHVSGIPMLDLIQEGNLGLMVAAEKFNYKLKGLTRGLLFCLFFDFLMSVDFFTEDFNIFCGTHNEDCVIW